MAKSSDRYGPEFLLLDIFVEGYWYRKDFIVHINARVLENDAVSVHPVDMVRVWIPPRKEES